MVDFLSGECPEEVLRANLGSRLLALRKPNGKLRPVAIGSVLRRLAARAACAVLKDSMAGAVGPHQYGVGRRAGCELVHKCVCALVDEDPTRVVMAFDACNAFGSMPRQRVVQGVADRLPDLMGTVEAWLGRTTVHVHWDERGRASGIRASTGVDQGCPLSPLFLALGLAATLDETAARLQSLHPSARVFAYLDDVVVVVPPEQAGAAQALVGAGLAACGLSLNASKTKVWSRSPAATSGLGDALTPCLVSELGVLGAHMPWLDREDRDEALVPVGAGAGNLSPLTAAVALNQRLQSLRGAGLSLKTAYSVLHTYAQSCANHLQRANYEDGPWVQALDAELFAGRLCLSTEPVLTKERWRP